MDILEDLRKAYKTSTVVSAALIVCLFIYALIVEFFKAKLKPFLGFIQHQDIQIIRYLGYALAILFVIINRILNQLLLKKFPDDNLEKLIQKLHRASIISMAVSEIPALLGFVLFLLWGLAKDFYALLLVSLFLEFMYFPRSKNWEDYLKDQPLSCRL